jgi:anti-sigma regulatory factor (Ser/Thr protein kinase)
MSETMRNLRLEIRSDPSQLGAVRQKVESFARSAGFDETCAGQVVLAMDEALTNIIRHAYEGRNDQPIEIDLSVCGGKLCVVLRDYGRVAQPSSIRSRDLSDVRPGGLGVHIITQCMESVEYVPAEGGGTRLTMKKTLLPKQKQDGPDYE